MKTLIICSVIFILLLAYIMGGRTWLKRKPWTAGFFALIEPIEIFLYKKSETILFARLLTVLGALLSFLTFLGTIDISPLMPLIPDEWESAVKASYNLLPLTISILGFIVEWLRKKTTAPIELVALPEKVLEKPEVAEAVQAAEVAKVEAVAAVQEAKG